MSFLGIDRTVLNYFTDIPPVAGEELLIYVVRSLHCAQFYLWSERYGSGED